MSDTPTPRDIQEATRQVAVLARLGYPLAEGLQAMGAESPWLQRVGESMATGDTLTQALHRHPRALSPFYRAMVEAAEASERPDRVLTRLSSWLERADRARRRVRRALFYPVAVLNAVGLELVFLFAWVVPAVLLPLAGMARPGVPPALEALLRSDLPALLAAAALVALNVFALRPGPANATVLGLLPGAGPLRRLADQALWARALGSLLAAGVDLAAALRRSLPVAETPDVQRSLDEVARRVEEGSSLAEALAEAPALDPYLAWAAVAGEDREDLAFLMLDAADYLDACLERQTEHAVRMTEPWAMLAVGLLAALAILGFWAPFYGAVGSIQ